MIGKDINKAIQFLKGGEVVGIPTETVYGLAGNGFDESANILLLEGEGGLKGRGFVLPLPLTNFPATLSICSRQAISLKCLGPVFHITMESA